MNGYIDTTMQPETYAENAETSSPAIITPADYRELTSAIVAAKKLAAWRGQTRLLQEKLAHAVIARRGNLPPDVITMNTCAQLVDFETREALKLTLVFPIDANFEQGRISVFDSLGVAMLGRRTSDRVNWSVPYGIRCFQVGAIYFQPETALVLAAGPHTHNQVKTWSPKKAMPLPDLQSQLVRAQMRDHLHPPKRGFPQDPLKSAKFLPSVRRVSFNFFFVRLIDSLSLSIASNLNPGSYVDDY